MVLPFDPPLLNSSNRWATTREDLEALYRCPHTGAVTIRTSLLNGFNHDDKIHQHCIFDTQSYVLDKPKDTTNSPLRVTPASSLNTLGYSPISLPEYISIINSIEASLPPHHPQKPIIFSVTGDPTEIAECHALLSARSSAGPTYMEINLSCPNIPSAPPPAYSLSGIQSYLSALPPSSPSSRVIVGLKTPPYTYAAQFSALISALQSSVSPDSPCPVSFITATNTLGSCLILDTDNEKYEPALASASGTGVGGLAGAALHPLALGNVKTIREMLDRTEGLEGIDVVGTGGVSDGPGYRRMRAVGAAAVGVGTAFGCEGIEVFGNILGKG
ncbi:MAG: dihydroorotate dehydrogenase [Stictis urceolatum]|nr:dihydroorotate dehydrogenase [Stictis urceolata]